MPEISKDERRAYIAERLHTDWGWIDWQKGPDGRSLQDILNQLGKAFGKNNVPKATMTIKRDIDALRVAAEIPDEDELSEARALLDPERFPEWRAKFFRVPDTGEPFVTPPFQHAIFHVMHSITFKTPVPQWAIDLLDELDPQHPFPDDFNELVTGEKKSLLSLVLLMAPRHGKTELGVHFMLHTFATDQNKRLIFGNGTQKKTEQFINNAIMPMMDIESGGEITKEFVEMYGPFKHDKRAWSRTGLVLAGREHTGTAMSLQPIGIQGNIRSFNADAIVVDDLQSLKMAQSESVTEDDYVWYTTELMLRREYSTALVNLGSHVASDTGDMFTLIENNIEKMNVGRQRTILKKIPAHNYSKCDIINDPEHTQCILWKDFEERDYGFLEAQRAILDDEAMFEAVYNQIPRQRKQMIFPKLAMRAPYVVMKPDEITGIRPRPTIEEDSPVPLGVLDETRSWFERPTCCRVPVIATMGFDPARSEKSGGSFSALSVRGGCYKCDRRYLIDWWKDRQSAEVNPDTIRTYAEKHPYLTYVNIEVNAYQTALSRDREVQKLETEGSIVVKEWDTDERKYDPRMGIPVLGRTIKNGLFSIPYKHVEDQEFAESIIKEYIRWPQKPNDFVMADWLAELALAEAIDDIKAMEAEDGTEDDDRWLSAFNRSQRYEVDLRDIVPD